MTTATISVAVLMSVRVRDRSRRHNHPSGPHNSHIALCQISMGIGQITALIFSLINKNVMVQAGEKNKEDMWVGCGALCEGTADKIFCRPPWAAKYLAGSSGTTCRVCVCASRPTLFRKAVRFGPGPPW